MSNLRFPVFLDLTDKNVLVVGGGKIALRRVKTLLQFDANVIVVAPEICEEFYSLSVPATAKLMFEKRCYVDADLNDKLMVLAATDNENLNHSIVDSAKKLGLLANNASFKDDNNFFFPAISKNENISVGICGTGEDHAGTAEAASKIRSLVEEL